MALVHSCIDNYERDYKRSQRKLSGACLDAMKSRKDGYNSKATCSRLQAEFGSVNKGMVPYSWQIDVAKALYLGLDCMVIAGTGAGKTMPFVIIISPLNALEEDQASRFKEMGLSVIAVNGDTWNSQAHKDITDGKYNVIITSPDMALKHEAFCSIISKSTFAHQTLAIIVDKVHCISQWGETFPYAAAAIVGK